MSKYLLIAALAIGFTSCTMGTRGVVDYQLDGYVQNDIPIIGSKVKSD